MIDIEQYRSDQRRESRYKTNIQAKICLDNSEPLSALITNISSSGLQLTGSHRLLQQLMPQQVTHRPIETIAVRISFFVPTHVDKQAVKQAAKSEAVDLTCHLVYTTRKAMDVFVIGCRFSQFEHDSEETLLQYLQHFARPE